MTVPATSTSDHFDGKHFFTPGAPRMASFRDVAKWRFGKEASTPAKWPKWVEITPRPLPPRPPADSPDIVATWINHATFLLQTAVANILFDPVFSRRCGPLGKTGPARVHAPGVALDALPSIDAVCLSHDHYDHCDLQSLRRLARRDPQNSPLGITPLGNGALLRRAGFTPERIVELDWWQTCALADVAQAATPALRGTGCQPVCLEDRAALSRRHTGWQPVPLNPLADLAACAPLRITLTPAQHWSKRLTSERNRRLWGGYFITFPTPSNRSVYFAGDTGYHETIFRDIAARLGAPDLAMLPIGAYEPRWFMRPQHCNPAEAVRIHRELGARQSVAMHWGTFQLTDEPRDEPPRALAAALREARLSSEVFKVLEPGESLTV